ncbi:hypothetical protein E6H27_02085 [Candidatus Bathyarchaeota archaeon]|nr:MAG: hypothetical protein E6H27_02085 [Candidatus Bathyarchaeota archaeon]
MISRLTIKLILGMLVTVSVVAIVIGASLLSISNTGTLVNVGNNLFAIVDVAQGTSCGTAAGYSDTGLIINSWNVTVGSSQSKFACVKNTGASPDTLTITRSGTLPSGLSFSSVGGTVSGNGGTLLVTFTLTASTTACLSTSCPVALNFGISIS